ncbi:MAG: hypothetical protein ACOYEV_01355 [Candidatus Nanopelagicales bacterium]
MPGSEPYTRVQAGYVGRLGVEVGVFVAVDHLRRAGILTVDEEQVYLDIDDWFREYLPSPPFYEDGNSVGAVTWFKPRLPPAMTERITVLQGILTRHGVAVEVLESPAPGDIIYQDEFQVGVLPTRRRLPTPLPKDVQLGPTTAGSKRHLARTRPGEGWAAVPPTPAASQQVISDQLGNDSSHDLPDQVWQRS